MKHLSLITILLFALVSMTSCENGNVTKIKRKIAVTNAVCPVSYGIGGDLLSLKYHEKDNTVLMYCSINEEYGSYIFLKKNKENMLRQFRLTLSNKEAQELVKDLVNAKAGITVIYKTPTTGKTTKLSLTYEELKEIKDNPLSDSEIQLQAIENRVAIENAGCPSKQDDGVSVAKVALVDDYIVYYYEMDEEIYNIKEMKKMANEMKENMRLDLWNVRKDPTMQRELKMLKKAGVGYQYRYFGNKSKEYVDVVFTPEELGQYISR